MTKPAQEARIEQLERENERYKAALAAKPDQPAVEGLVEVMNRLRDNLAAAPHDAKECWVSLDDQRAILNALSRNAHAGLWNVIERRAEAIWDDDPQSAAQSYYGPDYTEISEKKRDALRLKALHEFRHKNDLAIRALGQKDTGRE